MRLQDVAQAMLDKRGFFVVCARYPLEIGSVVERQIVGCVEVRFDDDGEFAPKFKVAGVATLQDVAEQYSIIGLPGPTGALGHVYRAVAE